MADLPTADLESMLSESRRMLEKMRAGRTGAADAEKPPAQAVGQAAEGKVRVVADAGGRIDRFELDPRVMRMASQELAEHLTTAVNAALDQARAQAPEAAPADAIDTEALTASVKELQDQGLRQMALINQSLAEVMARFSSGGSR